MTPNFSGAPRWRTMSASVVLAVLIAAGAALITPTRAEAATAVPLGTAASFAVLAGSTVTNTGATTVTGDLGVSPGTAVTGAPQVIGTIHAGDSVAAQAQADLTTAYNNAAGQTPATAIVGDLGGQTLVPGVYNAPSSAGLTGSLTLDAAGDPAAVWIFQVGSTLTTASASSVVLANGAQACNVFWQVGSSATLGTNSTFVGSILAQESVTVTTGAVIAGRALARTGAVTMDTNTITRPTCAATTTAGTTGGSTTGGTTTVGVLGEVVAGTTTGGTTTGGTTTVGVLGGVVAGATTTGGTTTGGTTTGSTNTTGSTTTTGGTTTGGTTTGGTATGGTATGGTTIGITTGGNRGCDHRGYLCDHGGGNGCDQPGNHCDQGGNGGCDHVQYSCDQGGDGGCHHGDSDQSASPPQQHPTSCKYESSPEEARTGRS
jgi:hypothetical protein